MRLLIVCSKNSGKIAPFVEEQVESLRCMGVNADYFTIEGKGIIGYLKCRKHLMTKIKHYKPDMPISVCRGCLPTYREAYP